MTGFVKEIRDALTETRIKATLIGCLIFGTLSQGMGLFNVYSCHDDACMLFTYGETYTLGRWLTHMIERASEYIGINGDGVVSLALTNGFFLLICVAIAACLIIRILDITDKYLCVFVGGLMVSVPTITCYMGYRYNAVQFGLALLLAATSAYFACGPLNISRGITAIVLFGCSAGAYQGFIPFAICVILFWCIRHEVFIAESQTSHMEKTRERVILYSSKIAIILSGTIFYAAVNKLYLFINHYEMISYRGVDSVSDIGISDYLLRILIAYKQFIYPSRDSLFYIFPSNIRYVYYTMGFICIVIFVRLLVDAFKKSSFSGLLILCMISVIPLACNFMIVMAGIDYMYSTMTYAQMMPFVLTAMLLDIYMNRKSQQQKETSFSLVMSTIKFCVITSLMILNLMYVRYDNKLYMVAEFTQQECISYFTTLITRIQSVDGYRTDMRVAYLNEYDKNTEGLAGFNSIPSYKDVWGHFEDVNVDPYWTVDVLISNYAWKEFMNDWCGYYPELAEPSEFSDLPEVENMPRYPNSGSICIVDDTIVVKF